MAESRFPVGGEVDIATAADLQAELLAYIAATADDIVLDCKQLEFIDSVGIAVFVHAQQTLEVQGRKCRVLDMPARVRRPFEVLGLTEMLQIEELDPA